MLNQDHCLQAKSIVCVLSRGHSKAILDDLYQRDHILATEYVSIRNQHSLLSEKDWQEMDMLRVIVAPQYADEVFEHLYHLSAVDSTEGAYMYQHNVPWVTHFELPKLPEEGVHLKDLEHPEKWPEGFDKARIEALKKLASD